MKHSSATNVHPRKGIQQERAGEFGQAALQFHMQAAAARVWMQHDGLDETAQGGGEFGAVRLVGIIVDGGGKRLDVGAVMRNRGRVQGHGFAACLERRELSGKR
ncbi:MAG: hypothetical protein JO230_19900 [Xanthobacteraceae bacterium]|nr:hypothetical protein [Xanthobacteraceae bacterium]